MHKQTRKPDWLRTSEAGSFAESTIKQRKPEIIRRIVNENAFTPSVQARLNLFLAEITSIDPPKPLNETALDTLYWNKKLAALQPDSWLDLPWYFAEAFFYRKVLEATDYFQSTKPGFLRDPFHSQKFHQMQVDLESFVRSEWLFDAAHHERTMERLILAALWGNRADLSHMDIDLSSPALDLAGGAHLEMLINDLEQVQTFFSTQKSMIVYFADNVGRELFSDLALIDFLLSTHLVENLTLLVKPTPLFVSDAMNKDVNLALQLLQQQDCPPLKNFIRRIQHSIAEGRLVVSEGPLLCGYEMFDEMPLEFYRNVVQSDLAIVKGDANYRRVIGDRHWDFTHPLAEIVDYFPTPLLLLRTLKSELIVDLTQDQVDSLNRKYENWLVKGYCGVVQLVEK